MKETPAHFNKLRFGFIITLLSILFPLSTAIAASVNLRWDPVSPTPDAYRIYARKAGQAYNYNSYTWSGSTTTCTIYNLDSQSDYYFVVRAYDSGLESANSNEVRLAVATSSGSTSGSTGDTTPPYWNGATSGIGSVMDNGTGGSVTVEFDTAKDAVSQTNLKYNVYYAPTGSWKSGDWGSNSVVADAATRSGSSLTYAVTVSGLTNNVSYTFGVRVEDQSGNEDGNTRTLAATPTVRQSSSAYSLMLSAQPDRSGAVFLDDAGIEGRIYVFVSPTTNIKKVEFSIDGVLKQTESAAPYDLGGTAGGGLAAPFDVGSLKSGYHTFSARITKTNGSIETINAQPYMNSTASTTTNSGQTTTSSSVYQQMVSTSANRSNAQVLDGATVDNNIYVFVEPITNIQKVDFYVDGALQQTESAAPYDLGGTAGGGLAAPFNAGSLKDGSHTFSVRITKTNGGTETISAGVTVDGGGGTTSSSGQTTSSSSAYSQMVSTSANRSNSRVLDGSTINGNIYVFVEPTTNIQKVEFFIDGVLKMTESAAPYDLAGTANAGLAAPFNTGALNNGNHTFRARVTKTNGSSETISAEVYTTK